MLICVAGYCYKSNYTILCIQHFSLSALPNTIHVKKEILLHWWHCFRLSAGMLGSFILISHIIEVIRWGEIWVSLAHALSVQLYSCRLFVAKSLHEPLVTYCQSDPYEQIQWRVYLSVTRTIIGSYHGLSRVQTQAIIWANDGLLLIAPLQTNCSETLIKLNRLWKKMFLKIC